MRPQQDPDHGLCIGKNGVTGAGPPRPRAGFVSTAGEEPGRTPTMNFTKEQSGGTGGWDVELVVLSIYNSPEKYSGAPEVPYYSDEFMRKAAA